MLQTKSLDDQSYYDILKKAMNRLPTLCPTWTDYNAYDPGVTLVELFSWYHEMQRFHLDQMTDDVRRQLLALIGVTPRPATPSCCMARMGDRGGVWPEGELYYTEDGIPYEISRTVRRGTERLTRVLLENKQRSLEVTGLLFREDSGLYPFLFGEERMDLVLEFSDVSDGIISISFGMEEPDACPRNPFQSQEQLPYGIRWFWNGEEIRPMEDGTHALSVSGTAVIPVTACDRGQLRLTLEDPGCEEMLRIRAIYCDVCLAVQRETWCRLFTDTLPQGEETETELVFAPAVDGVKTVFIRGERGWESLKNGRDELTETGCRLVLDTSSAVQDGEENFMVVCTRREHLYQTYFPSDGLPNQVLPLPLGGGRPVGELQLLCDTVDKDGEIRPMLWHRVADLNTCGPRDLVFCYDEEQESLLFGDGFHGAVVPAGEGRILVASLAVSQCEKSSLAAGADLYRSVDEEPITGPRSFPGTAAETIEEAVIRFLREFGDTRKCATREDYVRLAMETPGLRVAMAKAIPGNSSKGGIGVRRPEVRVVVVPYSRNLGASPDERFLRAIQERLETYRPICTTVRVMAPSYVSVDLILHLRGDRTLTKEKLNEAIFVWFSQQEIGQPIVKTELALFIQKQEGVWKIERLDVETTHRDCSRNALGDILLPEDGVACAGEIGLKIL